MGAIQTESVENILFSGIAQKVISDQISLVKSKNFYYYLYENKPTTLYLTSKTSSNYNIKVKIMESKDYYESENSSYPLFD